MFLQNQMNRFLHGAWTWWDIKCSRLWDLTRNISVSSLFPIPKFFEHQLLFLNIFWNDVEIYFIPKFFAIFEIIWFSCFFGRYFRRTVNVWTVWTCHVQSNMDPESMGSRKFSATCYVSVKKFQCNMDFDYIICSLTAWFPLQIMFKWFKCLYSIYIHSIYIYTVYIYIPPLIPTQGVQTAEVQTLPFLWPLGTKQNFASP